MEKEPESSMEFTEFPINSTDLYEILNVSKSAAKADIKTAYHRLSLVFHPDKQSDSALKASSQRIFHLIHTAYIVLSDPKQRAIYDKFGFEGIEAAWQLGPHLSDSEKILEEIERKRRAGLGEIIQSKTSFTIATDFSEIVNDVLDNDNVVYSDFLPKVAAIAVSEVLETSLGSDNHITAAFTAVCQSGNVGAGNASLNWRRNVLFPNLQMDIGFGFGSRKYLSTALVYPIDKFTTGTVYMTAALHGGSIFPQLNYSLSRVLNQHLVGTIQHSSIFGAQSALSLALTTKTTPEAKSPLTVTLNLPSSANTIRNATVQVKKHYSLDSRHELRMKLQGGLDGGSLDLGIHRTWSKRTRGSATVQFDQNLGTSLRLGLTHDHFHFILPLRFSQELSPAAIIISSLIPTVGDLISRKILYPYLIQKQKNQFWTEYAKRREGMMERKREEAGIAIDLMQQSLTRRAALCDLKVLEAVYRSRTNQSEYSWSVAIPLQFILNTETSLIRLAAGYRANVLGFFDIAPGQKKETYIKYEFKGNLHEIIVADEEELLIPQRSHIVAT